MTIIRRCSRSQKACERTEFNNNLEKYNLFIKKVRAAWIQEPVKKAYAVIPLETDIEINNFTTLSLTNVHLVLEKIASFFKFYSFIFFSYEF